MTHTLVILRHAKSDWPPGVADHRRPLSERGLRDAPAVGHWLVEQGLIPQAALVSPAARTRRTWELAAAAMPAPVPVTYLDSIYAADVQDLLEVVRAVPEDVDTAVLVGHNPGCEELAGVLAGPGSDPAALQRLTVKYPTAGVAVVDLLGPWCGVAPASGTLRSFDVPRG